MQSRYFGFGESPFGVTPDPRFLYLSETHREALASLLYSFYNHRGFTALIAPPGMGKTTLLFEFLRRVQDTARTAFLFNSCMDPTELLNTLLREIGIIPAGTVGHMLDQLNHELVETARGGREFVVVVDEAQNLSETTLETLRLLTNFETPRQKLMHIVLSGQPQLADKLLTPSLVQLRQRISTFCKLAPLSTKDTISYIDHRLRIAGYTGSTLFNPGSLVAIAETSEGIPRVINSLCFNSLALCHAMGRKQVDELMLNEVIQDLLPRRTDTVSEAEPETKRRPDPAPEAFREEYSLMTRMRAPALALALIICSVLAFWVSLRRETIPVPHNPPQAIHKPGTLTPHGVDPIPSKSSEKPATSGTPIEITVGPEQTLSAISVDQLGSFDTDLLRTIQELNPEITNPNLIRPGQKILLPRHAAALVPNEQSPRLEIEEQP